jgi:hypothetical protein
MKDRCAWKEPIRESLVKGKKTNLVAHALLVGGQSLLSSGDRFARK